MFAIAILELIILVGIFGPPIGMGIFVAIHLLMAWITFRKPKKKPEETEEDPENEVEETQEEVDEEEEVEIEELYFCQLIRLNSTTDLHIIKVEYCPDETAFIRIVTDESFTQPYKRKVMRDKRGERYINFNNEKYYLDPKKTQARMPE